MKSLRSILLQAILLIAILCCYGQATYASHIITTDTIEVTKNTESTDNTLSSDNEQLDDDQLIRPTYTGSLSTLMYHTTISQGAIVLLKYSPAIWLPPKI
jgi:hypothetical protein